MDASDHQLTPRIPTQFIDRNVLSLSLLYLWCFKWKYTNLQNVRQNNHFLIGHKHVRQNNHFFIGTNISNQ